MKYLLIFLISFQCFSATRMISLKNKDTGKVTHKVRTIDDSYVMEVPKNWGYTELNTEITIEDVTAQEQAEATAKTQRSADLQEIKAFIEDINNSDLKPWHKKILKFLVREAK